MAGAPAAATRSVLRQLRLPARLTEAEQQEAALGLIKRFTSFAEKACGCSATSNRAHVRRAVFHATQHVELASLVAEGLQGDAGPIESIARMECPVTVPDRTMAKIKVPESAPRRIIFASKALRKHFSLTETQTCRGCSKRSRCRFFKAPAHDDDTAGVKHIGRVLFGMSQYSRAHLQRPDAFPFYFSRENLGSAEALLRAIGEQLVAEDEAPYSGSPLHSDIEVAEPETARELLLRDARRKLEKRQRRLEERALSLPQWMRETLRPVPGPGMTERQRALLREAQKLAGADSAGAEAPSRAPTEEPEEWMEEGATPGELAGPLLFDPAPADARDHGGGQKSVREDAADATPITVVDGVKDLPVPERFQHLPSKAKERPVVRFSGDGAGIYSVTDERTTHRIDLDQVGGDIDFALETGQESNLRGGYVVMDLLGDGLDSVPKEVLQYVSIPPRGLDGVQRYNSGRPAKKIDPRLLEELWLRDAQGQAELPFLQRISFDGVLGRSGGSMPPARLPGRLLVRGQEAVVPPPDRDRAAARPEGPVDTPGESAEDDEGSIVELDAPPDDFMDRDTEESLIAEERLAAMALASAGGERQRAMAPSAPATGGESEDVRFAEWSRRAPGRPPPRPIGVLEPSVDFRRHGDPRHLDKVQVTMEAESAVEFRQGRPLPHDETFVSTFRKPLQARAGDGDPLGVAAPGVDIEAIKAECSQSEQPGASASEPAGLQQDSHFIIGGSVKFPKLPVAVGAAAGAAGPPSRAQPRPEGSVQAAPATRRLPPRLGRLRQARIENLSDLLRPGPAQPMASPALGELADPSGGGGGGAEGAAQPWLQRARRESDVREERNANIAMQRLLQQRLKASVQKRFPQPGAGRTRGAGGA